MTVPAIGVLGGLAMAGTVAALAAPPIVAQAAVEVRDDDSLETLTARVHAAEHALYPAAVRRWLTEPWHVEGRRLVFGAAETSHG